MVPLNKNSLSYRMMIHRFQCMVTNLSTQTISDLKEPMIMTTTKLTVDRHLIFEVLISTNSIFGLFPTWILQATQAVKIKFKIDQNGVHRNPFFKNQMQVNRGWSDWCSTVGNTLTSFYVLQLIRKNLWFTVSLFVNFYKSFGEFRNILNLFKIC